MLRHRLLDLYAGKPGADSERKIRCFFKSTLIITAHLSCNVFHFSFSESFQEDLSVLIDHLQRTDCIINPPLIAGSMISSGQKSVNLCFSS